jgi:hypothetical protein
MNTALTVMNLAATLTDPSATQPPGTDGLMTILGWGKWIAYICLVGGLIGVAVVMGINNRRGEAMEHTGGIIKVLGAVVLVSAAVALVDALN